MSQCYHWLGTNVDISRRMRGKPCHPADCRKVHICTSFQVNLFNHLFMDVFVHERSSLLKVTSTDPMLIRPSEPNLRKQFTFKCHWSSSKWRDLERNSPRQGIIIKIGTKLCRPKLLSGLGGLGKSADHILFKVGSVLLTWGHKRSE